MLLKPHVNVWLSFKQIQNLTQNGDFAPPALWRFLPNLHSALIGPYLPNEQRSLNQTWSVRYWSPMSMFGWVLKKIQNLTQNGDFAPPALWRFLPNLHSALIGPYLPNEQRSLNQTWWVRYWSPISMFGWVLNKSKIWPKIVILPPCGMAIFTDFACFFNSALKGPSLENEGRSHHQTWSVCYWSPMSMFGWVLKKTKIWPKMVIFPHPRYGDFYQICTPPL